MKHLSNAWNVVNIFWSGHQSWMDFFFYYYYFLSSPNNPSFRSPQLQTTSNLAGAVFSQCSLSKPRHFNGRDGHLQAQLFIVHILVLFLCPSRPLKQCSILSLPGVRTCRLVKHILVGPPRLFWNRARIIRGAGIERQGFNFLDHSSFDTGKCEVCAGSCFSWTGRQTSSSVTSCRSVFS